MSSEEYKHYDRDLELNFREITCKRQVGGAAFSQGVQDFDFSVSGKNAWIPGYSYFRIDVSLFTTFANGVPAVPVIRPPVVGNGLAFADGLGGCLYNNAYFRAGGQDVSMLTQYLPQASAVKCRLDRSGAWLEYLGQDGPYCDADYYRRVNKISLDGNYRDDGLIRGSNNVPYIRTLLATSGQLATGASTLVFTAATGVLTATAVPGPPILTFSFQNSGVQPGDILILGAAHVLTITSVNYTTNTATAVGSQADIAAAAITSITTLIAAPVAAPAAAANSGQNSIFICWQPPLGIFDVYSGIGSGDFKVQLNPNPAFLQAAVQSNLFDAASAANYSFVVNDVRLYIAQIKKDMPPSGVLPLSLMELNIINKPLTAQTGTNQLDFTVPPSTLALSVFIQTTAAGTDTRYPPTVFNDTTLNGSNLMQIQVTYGSVTKPMTLYTSAYDFAANAVDNTSNRNYMIQRWVESQYNANKFNSEGGPEHFRDWMTRGPLYHFDFSRDKNDSSSYVNVQIQWNAPGPTLPCQLFLVAHYSRQIEISYESGYITQVVSVNR